MDKNITIDEWLDILINQPAIYESYDICEHLETLRQYGSECDHITEMGVRWGASTIAFLCSRPSTMKSYDIRADDCWDTITKSIECEKINHEFILGDSLQCDIDMTELLFIDTLHTYNQLISELNKHSDKVSKYIILHDTISFGEVDENMYEWASDNVKSMPQNKTGLITAVNEFISEHKAWVIKKIFKNNNGLTILQRVK